MAQNPHPIDTIYGREPTYFYQQWFDSADYFIPTDDTTCVHTLSNSTFQDIEIAKYNHTDSTLLVTGIAVSVKTERQMLTGADSSRINGEWHHLTVDTTFDNWYECLRLYQYCDTGLAMLAEGRFNALDTARRMRVLSHTYHGYRNWLPFYTIDTVIVPIYEVYFEKPIHITGGFYVSTTNHNDLLDLQTYSYPGLGSHVYDLMSRCLECTELCNPQTIMERINHQSTHPNVSDFTTIYGGYMPLIFPIIDTVQPPVCGNVSELNVYQDSAAAIVAWTRGGNNHSWQMAYGRADEDPEGYTLLPTTADIYALSPASQQA